MTTAPTNCLTCSEWLRTDDPCVGLCRKLQHYTFQLEGDDCELFEFGTAREVLEPFVCDICGEDFAKYIVSRKASVPDVSTTQDVLIDIKTPSSIENNNPDYYKQELARIAELEGKIDQLTAHSDIERQDDKSPNDTQTSTIVYGKEREE